MFCQRLERMLSESRGIEVIGSAQDSNVILREIDRLRPDVLLLDIHLFGGSGLGILRQVKGKKWAVYVAMLTGDDSRLYREKCLNAGADYVLYKPEAQEKAKEILSTLLQLFPSANP